jgi:hypothetical protein
MLVGWSLPRDPMRREHHERPYGRGRWPSDSSW